MVSQDPRQCRKRLPFRRRKNITPNRSRRPGRRAFGPIRRPTASAKRASRATSSATLPIGAAAETDIEWAGAVRERNEEGVPQNTPAFDSHKKYYGIFYL